MRAALDVHKRTIVCAAQPDDPRAELRLEEIPNTERAVRGLVRRLGGPEGLVVCYEAGPCGYDLFRLLSAMGVACDIVAPALTPVAPGARVKTDRRDAKRLLVLHRAGALKFVAVPTPAQEGLRDLVRCRDDLVCARRAARHRVAKQLLRHGHVFREGKKSWTKTHQAWVRRQRLGDPLAQSALEHMLAHLDSLDAQIAALDHQLDEIAAREPWSDPVRWLCCFRGVTTITALGLLAELGDLRRFATARELMSFLGLTPSAPAHSCASTTATTTWQPTASAPPSATTRSPPSALSSSAPPWPASPSHTTMTDRPDNSTQAALDSGVHLSAGVRKYVRSSGC